MIPAAIVLERELTGSAGRVPTGGVNDCKERRGESLVIVSTRKYVRTVISVCLAAYNKPLLLLLLKTHKHMPRR